jgi:hypothetical protein
MPGLDPGIHEKRLKNKRLLFQDVDGRIKSGHDVMRGERDQS